MPKPLLEALRRGLGPSFANEQQRRFFDSRAPELLYSGAFGAGKSRILCEKAYHLGLQHPGAPIGIFRKVHASLAATTQRTFFHDVVPKGAIVRHNKSDGWYELANGSRFWFFGLDADTATGVPSKVGSLELAFAFVDEAVELTEGDWTMLGGRLRIDTAGFMQIAAATNPADPTHWLKRRFTPSTPEREFLSASTFDNRFLPDAYKARMSGLIGLYRQRYVEGSWIATAGGLFDPTWFLRGPAPIIYRNGVQDIDMTRIVVAIDPAVTATEDSDETGIIVAGLGADGLVYILADRSCRVKPHLWIRRAVEAYHEFKADLVVAEVNNGGDLVREAVQAADHTVPYKAVSASRGKQARHSAIVPYYVDHKVIHTGDFVELEAQMAGFDPQNASTSPDRLDALTWAIHELKLGTTTGSTEQSWIA